MADNPRQTDPNKGGPDKNGGGLARSVGVVGGLTLISRLFGYVRDIFMAAMIGAGPLGDAFTFALTLPNSFRQIFAEGAFNAAFVPTYTETQTRDGKAEAARFAGQVMAVLLLVLVPLSALIIWQMPAVVGFLSQGYEVGGERFTLAVLFSRIMFGYLALISLMALCVGMLNANRHFAPGPAVQIGYNVVLIAALVLLVPALGYPAHVLSVGVLSAGVLQFALAWLLVSLLVGITVIPRLPRFDARLRSMLLLMGPGILSASGLQIASLMNRALASDTVGAQAQLYYAERLYFLPVAMIGIAFGVVILPTLTRVLTQNDAPRAEATIRDGLELSAFLAIPCSVALAIMPQEILSTLFQYGAFDSRATVQAGWILLALALGLTPVIFQRILYPTFYARKDTLTPMLLTFLGVAVQVSVAVTLFPRIGVLGLGLSVAIAAWFQVVVAGWLTMHKGFWRLDLPLLWRFFRCAMAGAAMGVGLYFAKMPLLDRFGAGNAWEKIPSMAALVVFGGLVYVVISLVLRSVPPSAMAALRRFRRHSA